MDIKKIRHKRISQESKADIFLRKHVGLIHCENKLSLIQRKICNILLFNALEHINDQDIHEIGIKKLCSLIGYNSNDSKQIKSAIKTLISTVMEWNLLDDSKFLNEEMYSEDAITWNASSLLAGASIKDGVISYSYSPQMKSVLSSLDIYGRINLFVQAKFNSTYSLVLYENCVRFKNIKQTSWFPISLLRALMGVQQGEYSSFKDFNRKIINSAVNEINQKSDIYIEPQFKRSGRSISAVQFLISENKSYQPSFKKLPIVEVISVPVQKESTILEILISDFHLTQKQARSVVGQYDCGYIYEKITLVKSKKKIDNIGAYLLAALKQDYKDNARKLTNSINIIKEKTYLREAKKPSEIAPLNNKYMLYKLKKYTDFIQQQAESVQTMIHDKFEQLLKTKTVIFRHYKKSGLSSPFVMSDFISFVDNHFIDIIGDYLTFDDYITSDEI